MEAWCGNFMTLLKYLCSKSSCILDLFQFLDLPLDESSPRNLPVKKFWIFHLTTALCWISLWRSPCWDVEKSENTCRHVSGWWSSRLCSSIYCIMLNIRKIMLFCLIVKRFNKKNGKVKKWIFFRKALLRWCVSSLEISLTFWSLRGNRRDAENHVASKRIQVGCDDKVAKGIRLD